MPLNACAKKRKKGKKAKLSAVCKHDFPKSNVITDQTLLICQGLAKKFKLRVTGRRNAYGLLLGRRPEEWQSGTTPALAVHFRSNSHTMPNYRIPPVPAAHEECCPSATCALRTKAMLDGARNLLDKATIKGISRLAQRVQREATGYYCGYTFKGQVVGRKYILQAVKSLDYLTTGLQDKTEGQRLHRITNRVFTDIHHRCMARPAAEEWTLPAFSHEQDVTNAEFIRTYQSANFPGGQLVKRLDDEMNRIAERTAVKLLPVHVKSEKIGDDDLVLKHFPDLYGFRGYLPDYAPVYYLNPWEFIMLWEIARLPRPAEKAAPDGAADGAGTAPPPLTRWKDKSCEGEEPTFEVNPAAEAFYRDSGDLLFYPVIAGDVQLRNTWYMKRRKKPMVPAPSNTPMPDRCNSPEKRARLYSIYLRPWVMDASWATAGVVPYITHLNVVPDPVAQPLKRRRMRGKQEADMAPRGRSFEATWRWYIKGHVVSRHAQRIIVQFMMANCGKSKTKDSAEADAARSMRECPANDLALAGVHAIIDKVGELPTIAEQHSIRRTKSQEEDGDDDEPDGGRRQSQQMQKALQTTAELWKRDQTPWDVADSLLFIQLYIYIYSSAGSLVELIKFMNVSGNKDNLVLERWLK